MQLFKKPVLNEVFMLLSILFITIAAYKIANYNIGYSGKESYFGFSPSMCITTFSSLNIFIFFGVKEFFQKYKNPLPNAFIGVSGLILFFILIKLALFR